MLPWEKILDLHKRLPYLMQHLIALGEVFTNNNLILKVIRSLTRAWQLKKRFISEKEILSKMTLTTLFGKLQEYELELGRLEQHEELEKKQKNNISLKV